MKQLDVVREIIDCESAYISDSEKSEKIRRYLEGEITEKEALDRILEY